MKRLILFVLFITSLSAGAQSLTTQYLGAPLTLIQQRGLQRNDSALFIPADTIMRSYWPKTLPAIASKNGVFYLWSTAAQRWMPSSVDTSIIATRARLYKTLDSLKATLVASNIYTADGTLSEYRTVNLNGNGLSFEHTAPDGSQIYSRFDPSTRSMERSAYNGATGRYTTFYQDDQTLQLYAQQGSGATLVSSQFNLLINGDMQLENTNGRYRFTRFRNAPVVAGGDSAVYIDAEGYLFKKAPATGGITSESDPVATAKIGDLTTLTTTAKSTVVAAINEVKAQGGSYTPAIQNITGQSTFNTSAGRWAKYTAASSSPVTLTLNASAGDEGYIWFYNNGGGATLTVNSSSVEVNPAAGSVTLVGYAYDGTTLKLIPDYSTATTGGGGTTDVTPPDLVSIKMLNSTTVEAMLSEAVTATNTGWTFTKNGSSLPISSVSGSGTTTLDFTLSSSVVGGDNVLAAYATTTGDTKDAAGNELADFSTYSVQNDLPTFVTYMTWGYKSSNLVVSSNGLLKQTGTTGTNDFARSNEVIEAGSYLYVTALDAAQNKMVGLTKVQSPTAYTDLAYAFNFGTDNSVYYVEGAAAGSISTYTAGDKFRLFYNNTTIIYQKLVSGTWTTIRTSSASASGNYNAMVAMSTLGATFSELYKPTSTPDINAPNIMYATVENAAANKIVLQMNETMLSTSMPGASDFTATGKTVTAVSIAGAKVTLTVNSAYANGDAIGVTYTPGTTPLKDYAGNAAAGFTTTAINNILPVEAFVTWATMGGNVTTASNGITKIAGTSGWDGNSFARTNETFGINTRFFGQEGNNVTTQNKMFGLTAKTAPTVYTDLSYGINISSDGKIYYVEGGASGVMSTTYAAGDQFRVAWTPSNQIQYQKSSDGVNWTVMKTSTTAPSGTYYGLVVINTVGSTISNLKKY